MAKDRLIVKNFGPIKDVDIALRKVTVFIGEQASGKSVLAKLATLLSNPMTSERKGLMRNWIVSWLEDFNINGFLKDISYASFENDKFNFSISEKQGFKKFKDERLKELHSIINEISSQENQVEQSFLFIENPSEKEVENYLKEKEELKNTYEDAYSVLSLLFLESVYIPTERNLISILSKSLFNLLKNDVELPRFVKNFGEKFESSRKIVRNTNIEALKLKYIFSEGEDRIALENDTTISLQEASSGVQSIVPISVVIDAKPKNDKNLFIIEEPELNLYPTTQKNLVEYLIEKCTRGDNRLIITTHSPYILTALNNCIQAKNVVNMHPESAEEVEKLVPSKYHLDYEDIIAYHVAGGTAKSIMNEEFQMIDANELDDVSEQLGSVFDKLLNLKYQNQD